MTLPDSSIRLLGPLALPAILLVRRVRALRQHDRDHWLPARSGLARRTTRRHGQHERRRRHARSSAHWPARGYRDTRLHVADQTFESMRLSEAEERERLVVLCRERAVTNLASSTRALWRERAADGE